MNVDALFAGYLRDHQQDLRSIVAACRKSSHPLTLDEIVADVNLSLYKKRHDITQNTDGDLSYDDFSKIAYRYAVNITKWSAATYKIKKEQKYRLNETYSTDEGLKSSFDYIIEFEGAEDQELKKIFKSDQAKYFLKYVREYSQLLTPMELHIISLLEVGKNQYEIADYLGVTHQGVSISLIKLAKKLRSNIKFDYKDSPLPSNGLSCARSFFEKTPPHNPITEADRSALLDYILRNKGKYTAEEISKHFKEGEYTAGQINRLSQNMGVFSYLKRSIIFGWPREDIDKLIELVNAGHTIHQITKLLDISHAYLVKRKCQFLLSNGMIDKIPHTGVKPKKLTSRDKNILQFLKEGFSCKETAAELRIPTSVVSGKLRWFKSLNLLPNTSNYAT